MTNVQILILAWLFLVSILVIIQNRELGALGDKIGPKEPVENPVVPLKEPIVKRYRYKDPDYMAKYYKTHKLAFDRNTGTKRWVKNNKCHRELNTKTGKEIWVVNA